LLFQELDQLSELFLVHGVSFGLKHRDPPPGGCTLL
jgi:hypothetical protein